MLIAIIMLAHDTRHGHGLQILIVAQLASTQS